jgi:hypothetical protein
MVLVARNADASMDTSTGAYAPQISGLLAGEALDAVAACHIKAADNRIYMSNGTAANEAARCYGFTPKAYNAGRAATLYGKGARFHYGSGLTPGANFFVAATAGRLDTAATVGGLVPVAQAITDVDIRVINDAT